ncbi:MAG: D-cysteine desulfhydrase family protein, partial [Gammaproteobacteria bacterium]
MSNNDWLATVPRIELGHGPTPLEPMPRLSRELGGPMIWLKRDDCTGLATGGNKTRKLEYLMADALEQGADCIVTYGAVQSNHARQTAAACAKLGLPCHLLLSQRVDWPHESYQIQGNVLLDQLLGATVHTSSLEDAATARKELLEKLRGEGRRVYEIPAGGSSAVGALGYTRCLQELMIQCAEQGVKGDLILHASASAGTQTGLVFGKSVLDLSSKILGINVFHPDPQTLKDRVAHLATKMAESWPQAKLKQPFDVQVNHAYFGEAYGKPTTACVR